MTRTMQAMLVGAVMAVAGATGCDTRATPTATASVMASARGSSQLLESCAASADCVPDLRCFDQSCVPAMRSVLGDLQAAAGADALARGATDASIAAYAEALARYEADKIALPVDVDCAYGLALLTDKGKPDRAELAARVLHRCMLATPAGSTLHAAAMRGLASLLPAGLDPNQLRKTTPADLYLTTRAVEVAMVPTADKVAVKLSAEPVPAGKSYPALTTRLGEADVRTALVACWSAWSSLTKQPSLAVPVALRVKAQPSDYDDEPARYSVVLDPAAVTSSPDGVAQACVRTAIEAAVKKVPGLRDTFAATLTVTLE